MQVVHWISLELPVHDMASERKGYVALLAKMFTFSLQLHNCTLHLWCHVSPWQAQVPCTPTTCKCHCSSSCDNYCAAHIHWHWGDKPKVSNFGCQHCIQENFICLEKLLCFIYGYTDTIIALYSEGSEKNTQRLDIMMHKWRDRWRSASMPAHMQNHWGSSSPTKNVDDRPWSLE